MSENRPAHFAPGTPLGRYFTVEGLVRIAEGRMFYLVNDDRPDQPNRRCWECGSEDTPRSSHICIRCGRPMEGKRFLVAARWGGDFAAYEAFLDLGLEHKGLAMPLQSLRVENQLLTVLPYQGEGLMSVEAAPLSNQRILHLAQRLIGTLAYLAHKGVMIKPIRRHNLIISPKGDVRLFDLDIQAVLDEPVKPLLMAPVLESLAQLLYAYVHVRSSELSEFLHVAADGDYPTARDFGRAIEARIDAFASQVHPPVCAGISDVGLVRQLNEDSWRWSTLPQGVELYAVADGMGGHEGGEVASRIAVEAIGSIVRRELSVWEGRGAQMDDLLELAFRQANNEVHDEASRRGTDMGTTMVAMMRLPGQKAIVANVGDSRAYLYRDGQLSQITRDHSRVQEWVDVGKLTREEARVHPQSNILIRTVGTSRDVQVDLFQVDLRSGDRVLLCTDGLWGEISDDAIRGIMETYRDGRVACRELIRAAHQGGGRDNATMIIVATP